MSASRQRAAPNPSQDPASLKTSTTTTTTTTDRRDGSTNREQGREMEYHIIVVSPQSSVVVGPFQPPPDVDLQSYKA